MVTTAGADLPTRVLVAHTGSSQPATGQPRAPLILVAESPRGRALWLRRLTTAIVRRDERLLERAAAAAAVAAANLVHRGLQVQHAALVARAADAAMQIAKNAERARSSGRRSGRSGAGTRRDRSDRGPRPRDGRDAASTDDRGPDTERADERRRDRDRERRGERSRRRDRDRRRDKEKDRGKRREKSRRREGGASAPASNGALGVDAAARNGHRRGPLHEASAERAASGSVGSGSAVSGSVGSGSAPRPEAAARPVATPVLIFGAGTQIRNASVGPNAWSGPVDGRRFRLRATGYATRKEKLPSSWPMYEPVGVVLVRAPRKLWHLCDGPLRGRLPEVPQATVERCCRHGLPPLLFLSFQLPHGSPSLFGRMPDGETTHAVLGMSVSRRLLDYLDGSSAHRSARASPGPAPSAGSIALFRRWCAEAGHDEEVKGRFKCIAAIENFDKIGSGASFLKGFNAKPFLLTASSRFFRGQFTPVRARPSLRGLRPIPYIEYDCDVSMFKYVALKSFQSYLGQIKDLEMIFGVCMEGRDDSELPEQLVASAAVHQLDLLDDRNWLSTA
jgi:hypothetical protein